MSPVLGPNALPMRVVAADDRARGRLFEHVGRAYLDCLGYPHARSVIGSGHQLDILAEHATERRYAIAECKATVDPVGGADVNKLAGALRGQRERFGARVQAYFLALGGFRESALGQEADLEEDSVLLIDAATLRRQLETSRLIIRETDAVDAATKALAHSSFASHSHTASQVWITELGLLWAVTYAHADSGGEGTVLVHGADGVVLSIDNAQLMLGLTERENLVVIAEARAPATIDERILLARSPGATKLRAGAEGAYRGFVSDEFDVITTEGMPGDEYIAAERVSLTSLYSPQKLASLRDSGPDVTLGSALSMHGCIAVLGVPGGGKSTLVKRLVTAYLFHEERRRFPDDLPVRNVFPFVIRCRELSEFDVSIRDVLLEIPERGEFSEHNVGFGQLVTDALHRGDVLLLIDGLDEISSDGDRRRLATRLRRFAIVYPRAWIVVTSRPAGFRLVSDIVSCVAVPFRLAGLDDSAVMSLCGSWHRAMDGTRAASRRAVRVADQILDSPRILEIARVPLLLMTLLLVHRGSGELPDRRGDLYGKALEVLLSGWNVEAHDALSSEEVVPQLAWVAFEMMENGVQRIGERDLIDTLRRARTAMPEIFGRDSLSIAGTLRQVELRSSLLILVGRAEQQNNTESERVYEYRHLTFQEYLAARAVSDAQCRPAVDNVGAEEILRRYVRVPSWREVIPLAATHARRRATPIVTMLVDEVLRTIAAPDEREVDLMGQRRGISLESGAADLLATCLADGVQIHPDLRNDACDALVAATDWHDSAGVERLVRAPAGAEFLDALMRGFLQRDDIFIESGALLASLELPAHDEMADYYGTQEKWVDDLHLRTTRSCGVACVNSTSIRVGAAIRPRPEDVHRALASLSESVRSLGRRAATLCGLLHVELAVSDTVAALHSLPLQEQRDSVALVLLCLSPQLRAEPSAIVPLDLLLSELKAAESSPDRSRSQFLDAALSSLLKPEPASSTASTQQTPARSSRSYALDRLLAARQPA